MYCLLLIALIKCIDHQFQPRNSKIRLERYNEVVQDEKMKPFVIEASVYPFYFSANLDRIMKADNQIKKGKVVVRSLEELEAMADE